MMICLTIIEELDDENAVTKELFLLISLATKELIN